MTPALATTRWGTGARRALLIHGIQSSGAGWWRLASDLVGLGYEVTAVDLPGHGSSALADTMSLDAYRDAVLSVGSSWDLVLGHSLGGAVAVAAIAAGENWTARLILEDPWLDADQGGQLLEWFLEPYAAPITLERIAGEQPRWEAKDHEIKVDALRQCGPETVERTVADAVPFSLWSALEAVEVPTLLLGADPAEEPLVTAEAGATAAAANPSVEFAVVVGGSHSMHRDAYPEFWAAVSAFVR